jgi:hypothetical protein
MYSKRKTSYLSVDYEFFKQVSLENGINTFLKKFDNL